MGTAANSRRTPEGRPWKPGQSGNPSGRPKGIASRARELAGGNPDRLIQVLLDVAENEDAKDSDRIAAAREYLDRGWGRSASYAPVEDGDPLELDATSRAVAGAVDELVAAREAKAARRTEGEGLGDTGEAGAASSAG